MLRALGKGRATRRRQHGANFELGQKDGEGGLARVARWGARTPGWLRRARHYIKAIRPNRLTAKLAK